MILSGHLYVEIHDYDFPNYQWMLHYENLSFYIFHYRLHITALLASVRQISEMDLCNVLIEPTY
jgi:hypothetical protein